MSDAAALPRSLTARPRLRVEVVDFQDLAPDAQEPLLREMCALDRAIFAGAERADLEPYVRDPRAIEVPVVLYRDAEGRLVGQNIIPIVRMELEGRTIAVANSIAGMLPDHRRSGRSQLDAGRAILSFKLRHPLTPLYGACAMLHPRVYAMFIGRCGDAWPRPDAPTPPRMLAILRAIAAHDPTVREATPGIFVQHDLPPPRATSEEARRLRAMDDPLTAFYRAHVPAFTAGQALYCVMPFSVATLASVGGRALRAKWGRR